MIAKLIAGALLSGAALTAAAAAPALAATPPTFTQNPGSTAQVTACTMDLVTYAKANGGVAAVVSATSMHALPASCYLITQAQFTVAAQNAYAELPATATAEPPQVMACASDLVSYAKLHGGVTAAVSALTGNMIPSCTGLTSAQQEAAAVSAYAQFTGTAAATPSMSASGMASSGTATPSMSASGMASTPAMTTAPAMGTMPTSTSMAPATGGGTGSDTGLLVMGSVGAAIVLGGGVSFALLRKSRAGR
jgi:hypothetical protein